MMKHIKTFESLKKLKIGTYVICDEESTNNLFKKFLANNIGQIVDYSNEILLSDYPYVVKYENIPDNISGRFDEVSNYKDRRVMNDKEIIHWSKNIKDLMLFIDSIKYNI